MKADLNMNYEGGKSAHYFLPTFRQYLDPHEAVLLCPLANGFRLDDFVVTPVGICFDPTNVFASSEIPLFQALERKK